MESKNSIKTRASEIKASGISKHFGKFVALDDISLTIGRGEFLTLLGPSGSGKTTFLMVLAGFEAPTSGTIELDGSMVTEVAVEKRGFGMVFQGYALFPHMTVAQNIAFPLKVQRRHSTEIRRRVDEMIEMVGLQGHAHKKPAAMSGGQQQRIALARALACEPPVLLLDEPFSALDKNLRAQMQDEMKRLHRDTGTTFVFVTHDQSEALALSNRMAIFDDGKLQQIGAPRDVYEMPQTRFVAEFLGDINILPLTSIQNQDTMSEGVFENQTLRAKCRNDGAGSELAIRPEHMRITTSRPTSGNALAVQVTDITYLGAQSRLNLRTGSGTPMTITTTTSTLSDAMTTGSQTWVSWPEERGFFLEDSP